MTDAWRRNDVRQASHPLAPQATGWAPVLNTLPGIRVILFDVYGTLLISASGDIGPHADKPQEERLQAALQAVGWSGPAPSAEAFRLEILRLQEAARRAGVDFPEVDVREVWASLVGPLGLTDPDRIADLALAYEVRVNPVWPMPGFPELVDRLRTRFRLGVVSNAQFYTPLVLETLTGRTWSELGFEDALCAWSYRARRGKPSPALWQPILDRLRDDGIAPYQVLMVGNDQQKDVEPAHALGLKTILFAGDQRSLRVRADGTGSRPAAVVTALEQVEQVLV